MKDKHLVNLPIVSGTAKAQHMIMLGHSQVKKTHSHFPAKDRSHKKQKYRSNELLTFDDLHQMTLI